MSAKSPQPFAVTTTRRPRRRFPLILRIATVVVPIVLIGGIALVTHVVNDIQNTLPYSQTAAANLYLRLTFAADASQTDGKVLVTASFNLENDYFASSKLLGSNNSFACNGVTLSPDTIYDYTARVPRADTYACVYTHGGAQTQLSIPDSTIPTILLPQVHGTLSQGVDGAYTVQWRPGAGAHIYVILTQTSGSATNSDISQSEPDSGTYSFTFNSAGFGAISGSAKLTVERMNAARADAGFANLWVEGDSSIPVIVQ